MNTALSAAFFNYSTNFMYCKQKTVAERMAMKLQAGHKSDYEASNVKQDTFFAFSKWVSCYDKTCFVTNSTRFKC